MKKLLKDIWEIYKFGWTANFGIGIVTFIMHMVIFVIILDIIM